MEEQKNLSRRDVIRVGLVTGASGLFGFAAAACTSAAPSAQAQATAAPSAAAGPSAADKNANDVRILNAAIDLENTGIFAYTTAAASGKLNGTDAISKAVLKLATRNLSDHMAHRDTLMATVVKLGGVPSAKRDTYDVSSYVTAKEGNLDDLAGIARLALAIEVDACLAYIDAFASLMNMAVVQAAGTIAPNEISHATAIRGLLQQAGIPIDNLVPDSFMNRDARKDWVIVM